MPIRSGKPIMKVEFDSMHTIDTQNVENLFGLWSVFSKCAETMEDGRRLENLSWRLWNRETFCCASSGQPCTPPRWNFSRRPRTFNSPDSPTAIPELSSSLESDASSAASHREGATRSVCQHSDPTPARPELRRQDAEESHNKGKEKHITPIDLEKIVVSIKENKSLEKLPPLPRTLTPQHIHHLTASPTSSPNRQRGEDTTPRPSSPPPAMVPESSTSTVATTTTTASDFSSGMSPPMDSDASTSTELSSHSIVRGFSLGRISSSIRSSSNLAPTPTPILKTSPSMKQVFSRPDASKRKTATFTLGGSSGEGDESSLETRFGKSSNLTNSLKKTSSNGSSKTTSFKEEVSTRAYESEEVFESDSEEEESESAIEDDDDVDWEDEDENSGTSSMNENEMFRRLDSQAHLTSRRSLLTQAIHEPDRAAALQNLASRSTPAIRRSRTSTPNGPSLAASPREGAELEMPGQANALRSKPIIVTTSNTGIPIMPMSPKTTRRNMLSSEMTESLRKHLLWERQQKNSTASAHLKRRHTSNDVKNLKHYPNENLSNYSGRLPPIRDHDDHKATSLNHFDNGLLEYHTKGW
ncbi:DUF1752-domain-containing protein [Rhizodiscina lignyota]|uniref:DUF1752-domain-containing protein n=1 Tax=Rhizodiscina lignyota TaxID=1504668 RepID=A0A9P4M532_9PEZI|nr:DUF1752-domain-containing protein [Rhizodiscina lignyota]